jgi:formiminotetrahydrofolate cyclodeaminase
MPDSIWESTLAGFRDRLASLESVPAGVSTAAVTGCFALGLLIKVLKIASRRGNEVAGLVSEAGQLSEELSQLADDDIAAYRERSRAMIKVPLRTARAGVSGVLLCERATPFVHSAIAPDLVTAAKLLAAVVQSTIGTVEANLEQLTAGDPFREEVSAEARQLLQRCESIKLP